MTQTSSPACLERDRLPTISAPPSLSVVMKLEDLLTPNRHYVNAGSTGCIGNAGFLELIGTMATRSFSSRRGIQSRPTSAAMMAIQKHSFHLFCPMNMQAKLRTRCSATMPAQEFDRFDLRMRR